MWLYLSPINPTALQYYQSNVQSTNKQKLLKRKNYGFYLNNAGHGNKYIRHMKCVSVVYFSNLLQALEYVTLQEDTRINKVATMVIVGDYLNVLLSGLSVAALQTLPSSGQFDDCSH